MGIYDSEFESAFEQVQVEYPKIDRVLARSFISKLRSLLTENRLKQRPERFPELMRHALNDSHLFMREDREPYKVLAGKFYGRRGGKAAHRAAPKKLSKPTSKRPASASSPEIKQEANGQFAWRI